MNQKLCGPCAIESKLSIDDRKTLAFQLEVGYIYQCPECDIYFMFTGNGYVRDMEEEQLLSRKPVIEDRKKSVKKNDITQLSLF